MKAEYLLFRLLGLKLVWTIHNILPHKRGLDDEERVRWFYHHVDGKIIHFRSNIPELKEKLGVDESPSLHVIPYGTFSIYPDEMSPEEARRRLGIAEDARILLCIGQIRSNRGYSYFIEALEKLGEPYVGMVVGRCQDPALEASLRERARTTANLHLEIRFIPDEELQIYLNACDVVVLPYTEITTSGIAMLAFGFSKPVIASRLGSLPEVVDDDMGILIPPCDAGAIVEAVEKIFKMDHRAMGRRARETTERKYSWDTVLDRTIEFYRSL